MKKLYWFFKFCFYTFLILVAAGAVGLYYIFWSYSKDLPQLDTLKDYNPPIISEVFAENGTKVGEFWTERRILLDPEEIPKIAEHAIIASEDDRFFEHSGIDYMGIVRAMIENFKAGGIVQGGSTITQQVVKSFLLSNERTYERKIKEAILAKRLEDKFTKQEILYLYLNQIYLGNRAYGIEAAAQNYFHKPAKELTIAEAAMIAGLAKAPSTFSPIHNFKRAKERQEYVIQRMFEENFISQIQRDRALRENLKIYVAPTDKEYNLRYAPWFVEEVRRMIMEKYGEMVPYTRGLKIHTTLDLKAQKAARDAVLRGLNEIHKRHGYNGPLRHLDESEFGKFNRENHKKIFLSEQEEDLLIRMSDAEIAQNKTKLKTGKTYEALVIDVDSNSITAQVGTQKGTILKEGYGWARKRNNRARGYDGVIYVRNAKSVVSVGDVIEVKLVPGEIKNKKRSYQDDLVYFTLEETPQIEGALFSHDPHTGYVKAVIGGKDYSKSEFNRATQSIRQTGSVFKPFLYAAALDKGYQPDTIINDSPIAIPDGPGRVWRPKNYGGGYKGPMTFRSALISSRNVVSVRIILDVGTNYTTGFIRKLGITTPIQKVYSMSLGSNDMKPMEVAHAFGVFPTGGILQDLIFVKKITDRFGSVVEENTPKAVKNFAEQIKDGDHKKVPDVHYDETNVAEILRDDLWQSAQKWIEEDQLDLTPQDKALLYGKYIPDGYTLTPYTAYRMVDIMNAIVNYGTGVRVKALGRPAAGKTGTTNDLTDCWFVGYVPDLVAGVWVGYDQNKNKVGGGETGGKAAAPIFLYYMQEYLEGTPIKKFKYPDERNHSSLKPPSQVQGIDAPKEFFDSPYYDQPNDGADFFLQDI